MFLYQFDELRKDDLCTCLRFVILLHAVNDVAQIVEHGQQQGLNQILAEVVPFVADFLLDGLEICLERFYLPLLQAHDGMLAGEEEQGTDIAHVLDDLAVEIDGHHHA